MLATIGDLVEDIVVELGGPIRYAGDTDARILRRRGGSAANVAVAAAELGFGVRLIAQVGDDGIGRALIADVAASGVDVSAIRTGGATGAIVVLVDDTGERTMLTDRRAATALSGSEPQWLDGVDVLHVPLYSLATGEIARTTGGVIAEARSRGIPVSIDVSSLSVIDELTPDGVRALVGDVAPEVVFANDDEATALGIEGPIAGAITVVKRGARPAVVHRAGLGPVEVPASDGVTVVDATGAGDAFAAGFLTDSGWQDDPLGACASGHRSAARVLSGRAAR